MDLACVSMTVFCRINARRRPTGSLSMPVNVCQNLLVKLIALGNLPRLCEEQGVLPRAFCTYPIRLLAAGAADHATSRCSPRLFAEHKAQTRARRLLWVGFSLVCLHRLSGGYSCDLPIHDLPVLIANLKMRTMALGCCSAFASGKANNRNAYIRARSNTLQYPEEVSSPSFRLFRVQRFHRFVPDSSSWLRVCTSRARNVNVLMANTLPCSFSTKSRCSLCSLKSVSSATKSRQEASYLGLAEVDLDAGI